MYDWPELRQDTDLLWDRLRESLQDNGFPAPQHLDRGQPVGTLWQSDRLLLAQTCGLPFVRDLTGKVSLVGTPAYDIKCGAGSYYSVIVVHTDCKAQSLDDVAGLRLAYNGKGSQSGYAALAYSLSNSAPHGGVFSSSLCSGSHRESIKAVAEGRADVAAIDAVTWEIALQHENSVADLRVLALTEPTPGLPFVCTNQSDWNPDRIHMAVVEAMAALDENCRQALLLAGFAHTMPSDYDVIRKHYDLTKDIDL
jgi:ABC-type phosphate/phosphonate transport system substrate-binding protein